MCVPLDIDRLQHVLFGDVAHRVVGPVGLRALALAVFRVGLVDLAVQIVVL